MYLMFCENYTEYLNGKYIYLSVCGRNSKYSKDKKKHVQSIAFENNT